MIITSYDMQSDDDLSIKNTELYIYIYNQYKEQDNII